jgi:peptidoglycan/LPS O-acetylase OafA/YrhL
MVVLCHFLTKYQPAVGQASFRLGSTLGGVAVLLFFALSGMLICYSLLKKHGNPMYGFRNFLVDRFSRIYSGLAPAMLISALFAALIYVTNYSYFIYLSSMQSPPSLLTFFMTLAMLQRFPVAFFNSLLSPFGMSFALPSVTPFGFNGILWTLAVEWWIYMVFGWLAIGSLSLLGKRKRSSLYKVLFLVVAAVLSLMLTGLMQEFSSSIIVWFISALGVLAISSDAVKSKLSFHIATRVLMLLFVLALAGAVLGAYAAFAWTGQYYDVFLGLALSAFVLVGVTFLNENRNRIGRISHCILNRRVANLVAAGAGFSYTLFLTHYPIIIFLNGLNLTIDRFLMLPAILLITNFTAFLIAHFTEKRHKDLANTIKKGLKIEQ